MIQELLEELNSEGWTDTIIGARLGVSQAAVYRWRKGQRTPPLEKLVEAELRRIPPLSTLASKVRRQHMAEITKDDSEQS